MGGNAESKVCSAGNFGYRRCVLRAKWEVLARPGGQRGVSAWLPVCGTHRRALIAWNYESRPM